MANHGTLPNPQGRLESLPVAAHVNHTIHAGLPLESGLRALAEQTRSRSTRRALVDLSEQLERGVPLADAMRHSTGRLPRTMTALVEAGMKSGRLDAVMQYSVDQSQQAMWLRQEIWASLAYPAFLICFACCVSAFILLSVIPAFEGIFGDFGIELPGLTVALLNFSKFMRRAGWVLVASAVPLILFGLAVISATGRRWFSRNWLTSIPLLGSVFRLAALSEFCRVMGILVEANLPFSSALRHAADANNDEWVSRRARLVAVDIEGGVSPDDAALAAGLPNALSQVFRHVGSQRTVVDALHSLSDLFAVRCRVACRTLNSIFEPVVVLSVLGLAGMTVAAIFIPLIKLLNALA
ncbi:type II secretion system F family protein [Schlesneria sp.]|uniref:type II secretion system F family protein n=1 Tax=Schlesneria sp. TaxID=2762018 RepID=UPI002F108DF5